MPINGSVGARVGSVTMGRLLASASMPSWLIPNALTLSNDSIAEDAAGATIVGAIQGLSPGSTISLTDDAGGLFAISGTDIAVAGALDFETLPSPEITIEEDNPLFELGPNQTTLTIHVTDVAEAPPLAAPSAHTHWRFVPLLTFGTPGDGGDATEIEVEFLDATDTNVAPLFAQNVGTLTGGNLTAVTDGVKTGNGYGLFDGGSPWLIMALRWAAARDIRKLRLTARSTNMDQSFKAGRLDWSDDGATWKEYMTFRDAGAQPAANGIRTFQRGVPILAPGSVPTLYGEFMSAGNAIALDVGSWENAPDYYTVQWRKDGVAVGSPLIVLPGAARPTYNTVSGDLTHNIDATVIGHNYVGDSATATSPSVYIGVPGSSAFNWADPNVLTAHRYWRLLWGGVQSGTTATIASLNLRDKNGNSIAGTWTAWNSANGAVASLTDNNGGTFWGDSGSSSGLDRWLQFDLGAGNSAIVDEIEMTPRISFQFQCLGDFYLQYSDDAATWHDATRFQNVDQWNSGERKDFRVRPFIVQLYFDDAATIHTFAELEWLDGSGVDLSRPMAGASANDLGRLFGKGDGSAFSAVNDNLADYTGNGGTPVNFDWRFSTAPPCYSVSIRARSGFSSQAPNTFKVRSSRDGINFTTVYQSAVQSGWASNERRVFALPA